MKRGGWATACVLVLLIVMLAPAFHRWGRAETAEEETAAPVSTAGAEDAKVPPQYAGVPELKPRWSRRLGTDRRFPPILSGGVLCLAFDDALLALDAATGHEKWRTALEDSPESAPVEASGTVAFLTGDTNHTRLSLEGFSVASGKRLWAFRAKAPCWADGYPIVSKGSTIYFEDRAGNLYAIDSRTGKARWSKDATRGVDRGMFPIVSGDLVVWEDGDLHALDAETGAARWTVECAPRYVAFYGADSRAVLLSTMSGSDDFRAMYEDSPLRGLDPRTGKTKWQLTLHGVSATLNGLSMVADGALFMCDAERLAALDPGTGRELWVYKGDLWPSPITVRTDGTTVCFTAGPSPERDEEGADVVVRALDFRTGKLLWERPGKSHFDPLTVRDGLAYLNEGGHLLVVEARSGEPKWWAEHAPLWIRDPLPSGNGMLFIVEEGWLYAVSAPGFPEVRPQPQTGPRSSVEW